MIDSEEYFNVTRQFETGAPVACVDLEYFRSVWQKLCEYRLYVKEHPTVAISANLLGMDDGVHSAEQAFAVHVRTSMLQALIERGVLAAFIGGDEVPESVLAAAASIPCDKADIGEAVVLRHLQDASPEDVARFKQEAAQSGYDPSQPLIDSKFLDWLQHLPK